MKKVLYLTNKPSFYRVKFFEELGKQVKLDVVFEIAPNKKDNLRDEKWFDYHFHHFHPIFLEKLVRFSENYYFNLDLMKKIKLENYDEIIIGQYSTLNSMFLIHKMNKKHRKFILNTDGGFIKQENKVFQKIRKYFISSADKYISNSKEANKFLEYYGAKKEKIYYYHFATYYREEMEKNPVEEEKKQALKKQLGYEDNNNIFLMIGNYEPRKNVKNVITAWSKINSTQENKLLLIGNGPLKEEYEKQMKELEIKNVELIPFMEQEKLKDFYRLSDCLILNSKIDVWGLTISEAMTFGLPVISTGTCLAGTELIENDKNGYVIADKVEELVKAIEKIKNKTQDEKQQIRKNNLAKIADYTIEQMMEDYLKILE